MTRSTLVLGRQVERPPTADDSRRTPSATRVRGRGLRWSVVAGLAMSVFYASVVIGASGSIRHFREQLATDWYLLLPIVVGFGIQVGLLVELRRRRRMRASNAAAGVVGTGASTVGMVACCAHHLADLVPFVGATAAATLLYDYRRAFMLAGVGLNAVGITLAARRLRAIAPPGPDGDQDEEVQQACATA